MRHRSSGSRSVRGVSGRGPTCGIGALWLIAAASLGCGAERGSTDTGAGDGADEVASVDRSTLTAATALAPRPERWATPLTVSGVPNLHRFDEAAYRSAQPTREGLLALAAQWGLETVVNLRAGTDDGPLVAGTGLALVDLPMDTWTSRDEDVIAFLKLAVDPARRPLLVHCWRGADRTGLQVAAYRIAAQGWTKDEAIDELERGGYGFSPLWQNIPAYLRGMDVSAIRRAVGLEP